MLDHSSPFRIKVFPRVSMSWDRFVAKTPRNSIALDGMVSGGPRFDPQTNHVNFDHHDGVVREATMSTAMQVYFAIKGGLMESFRKNGNPQASIYINDTDQDTSFAVWLLLHYKEFERTQSQPHINRLLALNDRWDITGGAFPANLSDRLVRQHNWVFRPYSELRKSGALANATKPILRDNLEAVLARLDKFLMGQGEESPLDTRHEILYDSPRFKIVNEIGGTEARYLLFSHGMDAFVSIVATRPDHKIVYTVGRRSRYIPFPVPHLYHDFNEADGYTIENGWNGSDIIGGSPRSLGSSLTWEQIRDIVNHRLDER